MRTAGRVNSKPSIIGYEKTIRLLLLSHWAYCFGDCPGKLPDRYQSLLAVLRRVSPGRPGIILDDPLPPSFRTFRTLQPLEKNNQEKIRMSKLISLSDAIHQFVADGDLVYAAGFTHLIPFAAGHEIIRQGLRDLVLARATPDLIYDQMVAAGCARKVIFSYMGNPGVGSLRVVRAQIEAGKLEWEEYSHFGMISRLQAGATGLPFMPMNTTAAGDLERANPQYKTVKDPYSGKDVVVVPALKPDVAIVHVQRCDREGNAQIWGILGEQKEAAFAAEHVILTAEEIVDESVIRSDPNRTLIPGFIIDAVCHVPFSCHPSYAQGYYDRDNAFYLQWDEISKSQDSVQAYLDEWVFGVNNREEYWGKLGSEVHERLKIAPRTSDVVNYGVY
jgi:glutaconate CoA-transferase subunit A